MAKSDQLKALLRSHIDGDDARFFSIAMQLAAHEAKLGHGKLAQEIRELVDKARSQTVSRGNQPVPLVRPKGELSDLISAQYPESDLSGMVLEPALRSRLDRLVREHRNVQRLRAHGLHPRKKLLLVGPPGTGKTLTASALAGELHLPLFVVRLDGLMTRYMGETAAKLRLIFDAIKNTRGVYLFDEFDSIGAHRRLTNDVGEIRRVLNSFLQLIEQDSSDSLLIAATNHADLLDIALFRRFDDVIEYHYPDSAEIKALLELKLSGLELDGFDWKTLVRTAEGLSHADLVTAAENAIKETIIHESHRLTDSVLIDAIQDRARLHKR